MSVATEIPTERAAASTFACVGNAATVSSILRLNFVRWPLTCFLLFSVGRYGSGPSPALRLYRFRSNCLAFQEDTSDPCIVADSPRRRLNNDNVLRSTPTTTSLHSPPYQDEAVIAAGTQPFGSSEELMQLAAGWPAERLVANSLLGVTPGRRDSRIPRLLPAKSGAAFRTWPNRSNR
jgi:hypothetical protein